MAKLLPHGCYPIVKQWFKRFVSVGIDTRKQLQHNALLHGRHNGDRCFILGNGPSAKKLDLKKLKNDWVISISNGYFHNGFSSMLKKYHCLPQITYGKITTQDVVKWFTEMHQNLGETTLFLNESEKEIVDKYELFVGRSVHYISLSENFEELESREIIDITRPIPRVMSAPIMALMIAMYMGFKEIIIIGVDHDEFRTGQYKYAFNIKAMNNKDQNVDSKGNTSSRNLDKFQTYYILFKQYRILNEIANKNNVRILNATPGGELDEFSKCEFNKLFES